jgi:hypothetical protein
MPNTPKNAGRIDLRLLDEVELRLQQLIDSSAKLDLAEPEPKTESSPINWDSMNANLASWQGRLEELTRQTTELEEDLTAQEQSLRKWFETLSAQRKLLEGLAG